MQSLATTIYTDGSVANTTTDVPSVRAGASGGAKWQLLDAVDFILLLKHNNGEECIWD